MGEQIEITPDLLVELIKTCDVVIDTGIRFRRNRWAHDLSLTELCNVMMRIAELQPRWEPNHG